MRALEFITGHVIYNPAYTYKFQLKTTQVEFSNVVILNKQDLVTEDQLGNILDRISILNPNAKIIKSHQSNINVMEILNTHLYSNVEAMKNQENSLSKTKEDLIEEEECCKISLEENGLKCCKSKEKTDEIFNSRMSEVKLGSKPYNNTGEISRHQARFGITSFVYRTRSRPFHPGRLYNQFMKQYFMMDSFEDSKQASSFIWSQLVFVTCLFQNCYLILIVLIHF